MILDVSYIWHVMLPTESFLAIYDSPGGLGLSLPRVFLPGYSLTGSILLCHA